MAWSEEQLAEYAYQRGEGTWYDVSESQVFPWWSQKNADVTTSHGSLPATGPVVLFPATGPVVLCCCLEEGAEPNLLIRS